MYFLALKNAFSTVWRSKKLWIIGIFLSLSGTLEEIEFIRKISLLSAKNQAPEFWNELFKTKIFTPEGIKGFLNLFQSKPFSFFQILFFIVLGILLLLFFFWISMISQGSVIRSAAQTKNLENETVKGILKKGKRAFVPIAILNITTKILLFLLLYYLGSYLLSLRFIFLIPLIILLLFVYLTLTFCVKYAICGIMIKQKSLISSLKSSLDLIKNYFKESIKLSLILFFLSVVFLFSYALISLIVFIPFLLIMVAGFFAKIPTIVVITFFLYILSAAILYLIINGFLSVLSWTSWTELYLKIDKKYGR